MVPGPDPARSAIADAGSDVDDGQGEWLLPIAPMTRGKRRILTLSHSGGRSRQFYPDPV
jgi:hypothetical protein